MTYRKVKRHNMRWRERCRLFAMWYLVKKIVDKYPGWMFDAPQAEIDTIMYYNKEEMRHLEKWGTPYFCHTRIPTARDLKLYINRMRFNKRFKDIAKKYGLDKFTVDQEIKF